MRRADAAGERFPDLCTPLPDLSYIVDVDAGPRHSIALRDDGTVVEWGCQLRGTPEGLNSVVAVSAGEGVSYALRADGTIVSWSHTGNPPAPPPAGLTDVSMITDGPLALKTDGSVATWDWAERPPHGLRDVVAVATGGG